MRQASLFDPIGKGGILHAIFGTVLLIVIAIIFSVPMGILTALYLTEIKGLAAGLIQFLVQAMSWRSFSCCRSLYLRRDYS
jgi:phosphate transport system permease protein